jgi:hypothetical protein
MEVHLHLMLLFFDFHFCFVDLIHGFFVDGNASGSVELFDNNFFFHEVMNFLSKILEALISR